MELRDVLLTIIKILISVPAILLHHSLIIEASGLMGGHLDNGNHSLSNLETNQKPENTTVANQNIDLIANEESEDIPNASPLVLPGYNLPENIFNKGKPFYLEKDPITGQIDFESKSGSLKLDEDLYDYVEDEPTSNIYDKANINRKDGSLGSHKPNNINQLTPNFHDFLNLPIKYNSEKYVYPLISSSYANTKIQGNVNKHHNHKDYNIKTTTGKPTVSPAYYTSAKNYHFSSPKSTVSTTTITSTTTSTTPKATLTSAVPNLMNSGMNHPSFHEDFEEYYDDTEKPINKYVTKKNVDNIYLTTPLPMITTKRTLSVFEQLFGEYEDEEITSTRPRPLPPPLPSLFMNVPITKNTKNKYESEVKTEKPSYTTTTQPTISSSYAGPNVLTGSNMGLSSYEYEDDYYTDKQQNSNVAVGNTRVQVQPNIKKDVNNKTASATSSSINVTIASTTTLSNHITHISPTTSSKEDLYYDYDYQEQKNNTSTNTNTHTIANTTISTFASTEPSTTAKVTSLPLGEHHITGLNNHQPIIVATQNLRDQLINEKVITKPFSSHQPPSTSNVHIAPDQDIVSFVVSDHQNVDGGQYVGSASKGSPYDSNPFRPLYGSETQFSKHTVSYTVQNPEIYNLTPGIAASSMTIQPLKNSEASLAIGVPVNTIKQVPGQVVDEKLEIENDHIDFPKTTGSKVVFPEETNSNVDLPPPLFQPPIREVLQLNSKPMYHQLPSDLTPPKEQELIVPQAIRQENRPRPPWDPRPGHFHSGKPEYARPPRPSPAEIAYKRIDTLPNILPQFRPNMKPKILPPYLNRQPLLERPSNRPIGFFEKLQPPPPPKNLHNLRKIPSHALEQARPFSEPPKISSQDQFNLYQSPPKVLLANRRIGNVEGDVETLQMIQAKQAEKKELKSELISEGTDKPLYVVYPVNTPPIKLDIIENNNKESVVIGTRAELPLPPSKISQNFDYEQNPILNPKDRNDAPILKPHSRPQNYPIKSDFPYPLERPDPSILAVPDTPSNNKLDEPDPIMSTNEWNTIGENIESRIINGVNKHSQISVTLKTYTEKPIAVAYTPTESYDRYDPDKYSLPNYAGPVIPEIRPGMLDNTEFSLGKPDSEFTVSAIMHTHPQRDTVLKDIQKYAEDKTDTEIPSIPQLDFQAPFQASVNVDSMSQGWSVVNDKSKSTTERNDEVTLLPLATTSEFDIENFKPELIGGFKPIYSLPETSKKVQEVSEREE